MTRSGRSMTSSGSTRRISMRLRRRLLLVEDMLVVDFRVAGMPAARMLVGAAARRRFRSTLKALIFQTFRAAPARISRSRVEDLAGASETSSVGCLQGTVGRVGLSRGLILSTR